MQVCLSVYDLSDGYQRAKKYVFYRTETGIIRSDGKILGNPKNIYKAAIT